ncbi:hypothetical protein J6590_015955 [Homalodisca vitripennis]|nr:hypothetical protein J6590_015955 [Homalodisca vitripennis]
MVLKHPPKPLPTTNTSDMIREIIPESTSRDCDTGGGGVRGNVYLPPHPAGRPEVTWYRRSVHTVSRLTAIVADRLLSVQSAARRVRGHRISSVASQHAAQVPVCGPPTLRVPVPCQGFRSE